MTTHVTTHNPVRSDVAAPTHQHEPAVAPTRRPGRAWALAGLGAAVTGIASTVCAWSVTSVYDEKLAGDADAIAADLEDKVAFMVGFHVLATISALLMAVFAVGLYRRMRRALPADSLLPGIAASGMLGTVVVMIMGTGLDTEFAFAAADPGLALPEALAIYNHWIGTIPGCWVLTGLTGLALFGAARAGAVARWVGFAGLVLGGLSILVAVAPLQYMAGLTGTVMLLLVSAGFAFGDRAHRA